MKVEVLIPDGKYCEDCLFIHGEETKYGIVCTCVFLGEIITDWDDNEPNQEKRPDCPSLLEVTA